MSSVQGDVFLLGFASGVALMAMSAYRRVSPRWLRWLLFGSGCLLIGRYLTMALWTKVQAAPPSWPWHRVWFAGTIGLTLPSVFAVDQLIRHPAMTPKRLLLWYSPFLAAFGAALSVPRLTPPWAWYLCVAQAIFAAGFLALCLLLCSKIPFRWTRWSLLGLGIAMTAFSLGIIRTAWGGPSGAVIWSELLLLLVLWTVLDAAASH